MAHPITSADLTGSEVTIHTAPLPGEDTVLVFIEANAHVTHVMSLTPDAARQLVVGLLDALDIATLSEDRPFPEGE